MVLMPTWRNLGRRAFMGSAATFALATPSSALAVDMMYMREEPLQGPGFERGEPENKRDLRF